MRFAKILLVSLIMFGWVGLSGCSVHVHGHDRDHHDHWDHHDHDHDHWDHDHH